VKLLIGWLPLHDLTSGSTPYKADRALNRKKKE